jgi:hypothetical protein
MNFQEVKSNLAQIAETLSKEDFIYDLLLAYGISKTSITRLRNGDFNLSKVAGEVLYKGKVFFKTAKKDELLACIEDASTDSSVVKHKPRFVIVTDFKTVLAKDLKTRRNVDFDIKDLSKQVDFFGPLGGAEVYRVSNDNKADREAAYQLGRLYDILVADNPDYNSESHGLNLFLSRLLFCFFAEDTGIFEQEGLFTESLVRHTSTNGKDVHSFLNALFRRLNSKTGNFLEHLQAFPYVNGGLFRDEIECPRFSTKSRNILIECGELDWSEINPDIFGSMIQAVADPEERSNLGMHYTSVPNILKLIRPLFLDELNAEVEKQWDNPSGLRKQIDRMGQIRFFDPACGSGNFLIITYKELRLLEIKIIQRLIELEEQEAVSTYQGKLYASKPLDGTQSKLYSQRRNLFVTQVNLGQFYGIEIKDFAHEMALLGLWLAEHQMNKVFDERLEGYGQSKPILPLKEAGHITLANAARIDWNAACPIGKDDETYVLGNPPYLGSRNQDSTQKDDMQFVFGAGYKSMDYVSIWFYKGAKYITGNNAQLAFVSTNSICQGLLVSLTWPRILNDKIEISFAYRSFKWSNNAKGSAGVTVIILGLRNVSTKPKYLFDANNRKEAKNINAYLIDTNNIIIEPRNFALAGFPEMNFGNMPADGGHLLLSEEEKVKLLHEEPKATKWVKEIFGADEFLNGKRRFCLWLEKISDSELAQMPKVKARVELVYNERIKSSRPQLSKTPHLFAQITQPSDVEFILIPSVSSETREYIPLGFYNHNYKATNLCYVVAFSEPWLFGILHSKMHMAWVNAVGGKLKTDYRYSAKLVYNTFPFPEITIKQKETINQYVFSVLDERAKYPEKTMAWLYNPDTMPTGLRLAHRELDQAIENIYRPGNPFTNDAERLEHLFKRYEEMISRDTIFAKQKKTRKKKGNQ